MMIISLLILISPVCASVTMVTSKGSVVGQKNDGFNTFLGVPYAKVIEEQPFEDTTEYFFTEPFNASDPNVSCPQVIRKEGGVLQCLRLNIYVPSNHSKLPVFVWFHGGGFVMGNAGQYNPKSLTDLGIIVVAANYRLGPYGFLCVDGIKNQGLKDQISALRWVRDNIEAFGGDKENVAVGGQSYGGGAVDFHLYNTEVLFNKAIIESGSRFADGIETVQDNRAPMIIAKYLGYNANTTDEGLQFLNKANPINVMKATRDLKLRFGVCESEINEHSNLGTALQNISVLIGYNSKEDFAAFATQNDTFYKNLGDVFTTNLNNVQNHHLTHLADIVRRFYLGGKDVSKESMLELVDFFSDFKLNYAVERSVNNYLKRKAKVHKYMFSYVGGSPYKNMRGVGAYHTEELQYIFDMNPNMSREQRLIKDRMTAMWANFIKFGDPTPRRTKLLPVTWTSVDSIRQYLNIDVTMELRKQVYHQRMAFWDLLWTVS